jgi:hypothetical protein
LAAGGNRQLDELGVCAGLIKEDGLHDVACIIDSLIHDPVEHHIPDPFLDHNLSMPHQGQMLGNIGLFQTSLGGQFIDGHFTAAEFMKYL